MQVLALRMSAEEAEVLSELLFVAIRDYHEQRVRHKRHRAYTGTTLPDYYAAKAELLEEVLDRLWEVMEGPQKLN